MPPDSLSRTLRPWDYHVSVVIHSKAERARTHELEIQIANVVASFKLDSRPELRRICQAYPSITRWEDAIFSKHVVVMQLLEPKMSLLIYETGKVICSGAKGIHEALGSADLLVSMLNAREIPARVIEPPVVHNIVAVASYGREVDLDSLALAMDGIEYEPELFPGAIVRLRNHRRRSGATLLVFRTGRIVCLGCSQVQDIRAHLCLLFAKLDALTSPHTP